MELYIAHFIADMLANPAVVASGLLAFLMVLIIATTSKGE